VPINHTAPNPYKAGQTDEAWSYCDGLVIDWTAGRLVAAYLTYADKASAYSGHPPTRRVEIVVEGAEFDAVKQAHAALFQAVQAALDAHALTHPEFDGGAIEP